MQKEENKTKNNLRNSQKKTTEKFNGTKHSFFEKFNYIEKPQETKRKNTNHHIKN